MELYSTMKITEISNLNPWWKGRWSAIENSKKFYNFSFLIFRKVQSFKPNYIIRGPRQVGKTYFMIRTAIEIMGKNLALPECITYISCDRLGGKGELKNLARELKELLRDKKGGKFLLLDEVTYLKDWISVYKEICEDGFFNLIATGSRPKELQKGGEYFPGRNVKILNFYPLSFKEFVNFLLLSYMNKKLKILDTHIERKREILNISEFFNKNRIFFNQEIAENLFMEIQNIKPFVIKDFKNIYRFSSLIDFLFRVYLKTGGYPLSIENKITGKNLNSTIEEIPEEIVIKDTIGTVEREGLNREILNRLIPLLLKHLSSTVKYSNLVQDLKVDKKTVINYLNVLQEGFILREIFFFDGKVHPNKEKKFYFVDPFLIRAFQKYYGIEEIDEGKIVENTVIESLIRYIEKPYILNWKSSMGYSKYRGKEIDCMFNFENKSYKIEIKYQERVREMPKDVDFILTKDEMELSKKPYLIPVSLFLLSLK
ncbi:MAG: AAA family ATPase [candidate division WOR-3 bacterium]